MINKNTALYFFSLPCHLDQDSCWRWQLWWSDGWCHAGSCSPPACARLWPHSPGLPVSGWRTNTQLKTHTTHSPCHQFTLPSMKTCEKIAPTNVTLVCSTVVVKPGGLDVLQEGHRMRDCLHNTLNICNSSKIRRCWQMQACSILQKKEVYRTLSWLFAVLFRASNSFRLSASSGSLWHSMAMMDNGQ